MGGSVPVRGLGAIPLPEVSAIGHGVGVDGRVVLVAIGDSSDVFAHAVATPDLSDLTWELERLPPASGSELPSQDPQLEAIAVDGAGHLLVVQESPNRAELINIATRSVRSRITLEWPATGTGTSRHLSTSWADPEGSHTEGVLMLRGGRLLVVKEKKPAAVIEFGPAGHAPQGFGPDSWLAPGEAWHCDEGQVVLTALAAWSPDQHLAAVCPDFSDADVLGGRLLLLSDQGRSLALVHTPEVAADPMSGTLTAQDSWVLAGIATKPEGLTVMPDGRVLVACDRRRIRENLFLLDAADLSP